jgi:small subunit ribosomal protein S20
LANTESAKKQMRSNERRRLRNRMHIGRARSEVKRAREAIASGDVDAANEAVRVAAKWLDHAASRGSIHANNAARRKGRLMSQLAHMEARPAAAEVAVKEKPAKASRTTRTAKGKTEKAEKPAKEVKTVKAEKPDKAAKPEKPAKEVKAPRAKAKKTAKKE